MHSRVAMRSGCSALSPRRRVSAATTPSPGNSSQNSDGSCRPTGSVLSTASAPAVPPTNLLPTSRVGVTRGSTAVSTGRRSCPSWRRRPVTPTLQAGSFAARRPRTSSAGASFTARRRTTSCLSRSAHGPLELRLRIGPPGRTRKFGFDRVGGNFSARLCCPRRSESSPCSFSAPVRLDGTSARRSRCTSRPKQPSSFSKRTTASRSPAPPRASCSTATSARRNPPRLAGVVATRTASDSDRGAAPHRCRRPVARGRACRRSAAPRGRVLDPGPHSEREILDLVAEGRTKCRDR